MLIFKEIMEMQICFALFYLLYLLLLHTKISFRLSRFFLLMIFPVSVLIPIINIPVSDSYNVFITYLPSLIVNDFKTSSMAANIRYAANNNIIIIQAVIFSLYITGAIIVFLINMYALLRGIFMIRKGEKGVLCGREVIFTDCKGGAFSIFGKVVIDKQFADCPAALLIIDHEYLHKKYIHSADLCFMLFAKSIFWFNPLVWFAGRSLRQLHEYEVDANMIVSGADPKQYAQLLLDYEMGIIMPVTANRFSYLSIKERLKMMKTNSYKSSLRILYALPLAVIMIAMFSLAPQSCKSNQSNKDIKENIVPEEQTVADEVKQESSSSEVSKTGQQEAIGYSEVAVKPTFQNGDQNAFVKWIFENISYPESAKRNNISGRVILKFTIAEDGSIGDVKILKGVNKELDAEAIRVVSASPKWTPGKQNGKAVPVTFIFPIIFQLK